MTELPEGWTHSKLGDVVERVGTSIQPEPSGEYREIGVRSFGRGVFVKPPTTGAAIGNKRVFRVVPDSLVANIVFAWEGAISRTTEEHKGLVASHRFPMWKPIPEKVDLDYLAYFFTTSCGISLAAAASPGGAGRNKTLNRSTFEEASILLPPVAEQKKLVDILASVDEAIQANEKVFKQTDKVKQGILERLMVKTISDDDAAKSPQWETKNLGEIANVFNGPGKKSGGSIVRIFKTKHVYDGFIREDTPEYLPDDLEHTIDEFDFLKEGDVLTPNMAHSTIGRVAYVRKLGYPAICDGQVMVIRAKNGAVKPRFLFDFLSSRAGRSELLAREVGSIFGPARGQTHLYPRDVRTIQLPLPPPKVQEKLSAIETLDVQMEKTSQLLSQLRVLKEGLLQNLLSGKVRVRL